MKKYAFFDIDGTLYDGSTSEDLIIHLFTRDLIDDSIMTEYKRLNHEFRDGKIDYHQLVELVMHETGKALSGQIKEEVEQSLLDYYIKNHKLREYSFPIINYLRENDFETYLISAALEPSVKSIAKILDVPNYFFSDMEVESNRYSGKVTHILHSEEKKSLVESVLNKNNSEENYTMVAFGDSTGDSEMLKLSTCGFLIEPYQEELIDMAKKNDWHITTNASDMIRHISGIL